MRDSRRDRPQPVRRPKGKGLSQMLDKFDSATARALKPDRWLTFAGYRGLRMTASGQTRTFAFRYRSPIDGKIRRIRIGSWPATPWERAVTIYRDLKEKRDEGVDPALERKKKRLEARKQQKADRKEKQQAEVTVRAVCDRYLREHVNVASKTEKSKYIVKRMFEGRVYPVIGDRSAHMITRSDAADFLAAVKIDAPQVARLLRGRLGGAWSHAMDRKDLPDGHANPWREALKGKLKASSRTRYLDDAELSVFLAKLPTIEREDARDALHLTLLLATRPGEVGKMDWSAIDLERGTWTLHETKTESPRTIRLPRQAIEILAARGEGFESLSKNPELRENRLAETVRKCKRFGLRNKWNPHDLRRSADTGMARLGIRKEVREAALGHTKGGMEGVYNLHVYEREVGEALQMWCDHLDALSAPTVKAFHRKSA